MRRALGQKRLVNDLFELDPGVNSGLGSLVSPIRDRTISDRTI
jgi:hypothetical protein